MAINFDDWTKIAADSQALMLGEDPELIPLAKGKVAAVMSSDVACNMICKMAHAILSVEDDVSAEQILYDKLQQKVAYSPEEKQMLIEPVLATLGLLRKRAGIQKQAAPWLALGKRVTPFIPDLLKTVVATGAVGGSAIGAGLWGLQRNLTQDDDDIEALEQQTKEFRRAAKDIRNRIRLEDRMRQQRLIEESTASDQ